MRPLTPKHITDLTAILLPQMADMRSARARLSAAFGPDSPILHLVAYEGSPGTFVTNLITMLYQFGALPDGRPALWALLEAVRPVVGLEHKQRIDALRPLFELAPPPRLDRIFISYSHTNERDAMRIVSNLKDAGLRVWFDREKIKGGQPWWASIEHGIREADHFVFCLSSDALHSDVACDELNMAHDMGKPIYPIMLEDCHADLAMLDSTDLAWLPELHYIDFTEADSYGAKLRDLIRSLPGFSPPDTYFIDEIDARDLVNPYRGLQHFTELEADFFFGREDLAGTLMSRLVKTGTARVLAIVGASGTGKSSLVRAGLIPEIRKRLPYWDTLIVRPGESPIETIADRLQERMGTEAGSVRAQIRTQPAALDDITSSLMLGTPQDARFILFIDQFEELLKPSLAETCQILLERLTFALNRADGRLYLILTMRAEYLDALSHAHDFAQLVEQNLAIATELTPGQLRRSIEGPALASGVSFEDGLVEQILEDVRDQPGTLPLMQFALKELFDRRLGRKLTRDAYELIGGVKGALATRAHETYESFSTIQQQTMRRILLRMAVVEEDSVTRRRIARPELAFADVPDDQIDTILARLADPDVRLLVASRSTAAATGSPNVYEVCHEALFSHWDMLKQWIDTERGNLRTLQHLRGSLTRWTQSGHETPLLADDVLLSAGKTLDDALLAPAERVYLSLSRLRAAVLQNTDGMPTDDRISDRIDWLIRHGVDPTLVVDVLTHQPMSAASIIRVVPQLRAMAPNCRAAGDALYHWGLNAETIGVRRTAIQSWWEVVEKPEALQRLNREASRAKVTEALAHIKDQHGLPLRGIRLMTHLQVILHLLQDAFSEIWRTTLVVSATASLGFALSVAINFSEIYFRGEAWENAVTTVILFLARVVLIIGPSATGLLLIGLCAHGVALVYAGPNARRMRTVGALVGGAAGLAISFGMMALFSADQNLTELFDLPADEIFLRVANFPWLGALLAVTVIALTVLTGEMLGSGTRHRIPTWTRYLLVAVLGGLVSAIYASMLFPQACYDAQWLNDNHRVTLLCSSARTAQLAYQLPFAYFSTGAFLALGVTGLRLGLGKEHI